MANYYLDWEFKDDGNKLWPISLGVVSDDGREYYAEAPDAREIAASDPWLRDNVLPHLDDVNIRAANDREMGADLVRFVNPDKSVRFWGYYVSWDWYLTCRLYGLMLNNPLGHRANDIAQEAQRLGIRFQTNTPRHKAIDCARWTRDQHLKLIKASQAREGGF